ncbi:Oligosaccharyltransferase complex/magnesium transporter family protein [Perilla frutescens var. hirtella]|nr:Oligosaccharyltransferase complex/magnesium transporter family protein [Perilla frutescens var. frutescens]KAH6775995.1 Oligosaccharyltransferase complex/magnesium transporter family protein [Perilla frutescens var. hirtella]
MPLVPPPKQNPSQHFVQIPQKVLRVSAYLHYTSTPQTPPPPFVVAMAISPTPFAAAAALLLLSHLFLLMSPATSRSSEPIMSELSALQSQSPTGVIHLSDALLRRILSLPTPRPFHALIFFDAQQLHSKAELSLPTLKSEFALVSTSFQSNNPNQKSQLFFFEIEFQESQASFALFGVNSLPHIRLIPPTASDLKSDAIQMDASDYSRMADSMAEFIESRAKFSVGPINRPPVVSKKQIFFIVAVILIWTPFFLKKLISGNTILHDKNIWMAGAVFIYFFSVSGAMFNIIRKMPMFMADRQDPGKLVFFYQGSGMQLGAEGFSIGFLYTIVGLLLAFVTHVLVRVKNRTVQRVLMLFVLFVSFWAVKKVIFLDNWKTGYGIHGYMPSSWL